MILALVKPKYFIPVHGEHRHLELHKRLAMKMGMKADDIFVMANGMVLEIDDEGAAVGDTVPSGKILIDGLGVGDVGNIVLRDRKLLAQDGLIIVVATLNSSGYIISGPDIISRGFVYVRESEDIIDHIREVARECLIKSSKNRINDWAATKHLLKTNVSKYIYETTNRSPMILPILMEI